MELFKKQSQESCSQIFVAAHVVYVFSKEDNLPFLGTNISLTKISFEDDFSFSRFGGICLIVSWRVGLIHDGVGLGVRGVGFGRFQFV